MNPLELRGPAFLLLYVCLLGMAVPFAIFLRWRLRGPGGRATPDLLERLDAVEVAYLVGGAASALAASLARLVRDGALRAAEGGARAVRPGDGAFPENPTELERRILETAARAGTPETEVPLARIREASAPAMESIRARLQGAGLLAGAADARSARAIPSLLFVALGGLALAKIGVGISRDRPVAFLVMLCIPTLVFALLFARSVHRSRRGDRAVRDLRRRYAALGSGLARQYDRLAGQDLAMAAGLFGLGVFAGTPLAHLRNTLAPPPSADTGSCGGGGDGGGGSSCGGGGGCGGCGGD